MYNSNQTGKFIAQLEAKKISKEYAEKQARNQAFILAKIQSELESPLTARGTIQDFFLNVLGEMNFQTIKYINK